MNMLQQVYISLGGNMGNTQEIFQKALKEIEEKLGHIVQKSSLYRTAPWGNTQQSDFLNQVILLETEYSPEKLLDNLLTIELLFGRERNIHWGPRTLDLDILFYGELILNKANLTIPHPRITERRFILAPLQQIAAEWLHPLEQKTIQTLLNECKDTSSVEKLA